MGRAGSEALNVIRKAEGRSAKTTLEFGGACTSAHAGPAEMEPVSGRASIEGTCADVRCVAGGASRR